MKDTLIKLAIGIAIGVLLMLSLLTCVRNKPTPVVTKKQGETVLVSTKTETIFDTLRWIATYKANTKPVIKWLKTKATHDTTERQPNYYYSPCDSVFNIQDTGAIEGIEYAIIDTISDNRVIGRSIKLEVPQSQITKQVFKTNDSLRVDTVYVTTKEKKKRFSVNVGTGLGFSPISPQPEPQIGIQLGVKLFSF